MIRRVPHSILRHVLFRNTSDLPAELCLVPPVVLSIDAHNFAGGHAGDGLPVEVGIEIVNVLLIAFKDLDVHGEVTLHRVEKILGDFAIDLQSDTGHFHANLPSAVPLPWGVKPFMRLEKILPRFLHVRRIENSQLKVENE